MVAACVEMLGPLVGGLDRYVAALRRGDGVGWHELGEQYWHGADALTRVSLPAPVMGSVLDAAGVAERLHGGGKVLDVACGYGTPTLALAEHLPATTVVGIDYNSGSVDEARRRAQRAGVSDRVRFSRATATEPPSVDGGYDLITFVDALHDLGDPVGAPWPPRDVSSRRTGPSCWWSSLPVTAWPPTCTRSAGCSTPCPPWCAPPTRSANG